MGIGNKLVFDVNGNVEDFIFILSTKDFRHLGAIQNVVPESVNNHGSLSSADEISFEVYKTVEKEIDDKVKEIEEPLWDEIVDLKLVYVRELDKYFEINVQLDDSTEIVKKTVTCTSLCEAELGQIHIRGLEINSDADIARDDYEPTVFYNPENHDASLLHRVLSFAPHYTIKHVDESLKKLQRTFSVDEAFICDWLTSDCANEFNCLFQFDTTTRGVYVYDLYTVCKKCGHRGDYIDECPECGCKDLDYFGDDSTIYIDKENLTDAVQLTTDAGSIKNCFYLEAGDDIITAIVRMLIMNGTGFIFMPTDDQIAEMPQELRDKIAEYNELYLSKQDEYEGIISDLFGAQSKIDYYTHTMMPTIEHAEVTAQTEADKLTAINLSPLGLSSLTESTSKTTVESALVNYAKLYVKTGNVKIEISQSNYTFIGIGHDGYNHGKWTGNFKVINWSDSEDVVYSNVITIDVTENYQEFLEQRIMKNILSGSDEEDSVFNVLAISELEDFTEALKLYGLKSLESFASALQSALDVLLEEDQASEEADFYEPLYLPYYKKLQACEKEIDARQMTIDEWQNTYDNLELQRQEIQADLNLQDYLGEDLYRTFCMYRRDDIYRNENYISDGLSDSEQIQKAKDFIEVAKKELERARTSKYSISTTLHNLLIIPAFKPLKDYFKLGNWLRICVDGTIYRLRLIGYDLSFSSIQTLSVEFANVTKLNTVASQSKELLDNVKSMSSNFDYFVAQAKKGNEANVEITRWLETGLDSALVNIKNNNNEEVTYDKHGIHCKTYDDITGNYSPEQLRLTHNIIALTSDNWLTSSLAIGKHKYTYFDGMKFTDDTGFGVSAKFLNSAYFHSGQIIGADIYSENYEIDENGNVTKGTHLALKDGSFNFGAGSLTYDITNGLSIKGNITSGSTITGSAIIGGSLLIGDKNSTSYAEITESGILNCTGANITGTIHAEQGGTIAKFNIGDDSIYNGTDSLTSTTKGIYLGTDGIRQYESDTANVTITKGILKAYGADITGIINATKGGTIAGFTIGDFAIYNGTDSLTSTTSGVYLGTDGIRQYESATANITMSKGVLTANGADISGTIKTNNITATGGKIGGWSILGNDLRAESSGNFLVRLHAPTELGTGGNAAADVLVLRTGADTDENPYRYPVVLSSNGRLAVSDLYVTGGSITIGSNFGVSTTGVLTCSGANINGVLTAGTGSSIGSWKVDSNSIYSGTWNPGTNTMADAFISTGTNSSYKIGNTAYSNLVFGAGGNFGVTKSGAMYAVKGKIGNWSINEDYLMGRADDGDTIMLTPTMVASTKLGVGAAWSSIIKLVNGLG